MDILDKLRKMILGYEEIGSASEDKKRIVAYRESDGTKLLTYDGVTYSRITPGIYTHSYWDYFIPLTYLYKEPKVLLIGLGGGTTVTQLEALLGSHVHLDVVEVSKSIIEVYKKMNPEAHANIIIADGAEFVAKAKESYNVIILDAYKGSKIPEQFLSSSFVSDASNALLPGGVLAINFVLDTKNIIHYTRYLKDLSMLFSTFTLRYRAASLNEIIIAAKGLNKNQIIEGVAKMPVSKENAFLIEDYRKIQQVP
jgi:spermidine synthase